MVYRNTFVLFLDWDYVPTGMNCFMNFANKITYTRPYNSAGSKTIKAYESDRGRIINSAAIRRLQQKTQVFPLERNSAVRSRLTHSMEVQQVGRFIVHTIFEELDEQQKEDWGLITPETNFQKHFETLVEMSCLMHDIGNPPFGHFGEAAISEWFAQNLETLCAQAQVNLTDDLQRDLSLFEGNAQGIRLISNLLTLNLTFTQAAGILKYTRCGTQPKPSKTHPHYYLQKKVGFYWSEQDYVQRLCEANSMEIGARHPIAYVMEAADDISYCIADLEDGLEKNIFTQTELSDAINREYQQRLADESLGNEIQKQLDKLSTVSQDDRSDFLVQFRVKLVHPLVKHAAKQFIKNIEEVYSGTLSASLLEDNSAAHALTEALKAVARELVFCHEEVEERELQGYRIIAGLLSSYKPLLAVTQQQFIAICNQDKGTNLLCRRLVKKLPERHMKAYFKAIKGNDDVEFYFRCRLIQDYISGMTDQFAYDEYRMLNIIG